MISSTNRLLKKVRSLSGWVKTGGVIVVAIVGIWAAGYKASAFLDGRYTLAAASEQHAQEDIQRFAESKLLFLENRQGQLEEQQFKLKIEQEKRPLIGLERERLDQIEKDLGRINKQIELEQKKANPVPR
mgnify:CR=1 FL=1